MKTINVVAAIILEGDKAFVTQRGYGAFKDKWEFPGGKIEPGETPEKALVREIREELNTEIAVDQSLDTIDFDYPEFHLKMECFCCRIIKGELNLLEHESSKWVTAETISDLDWLPADRILLPRIAEILNMRRETDV